MKPATLLLKTYRLVSAVACFLASAWVAYRAGTITAATGLSFSNVILFQIAISLLYLPFMRLRRLVRPPEPGTRPQDLLAQINAVGINTENMRHAKRRIQRMMLGNLATGACFWILTALVLYAVVQLNARVSLSYLHYCAALMLPIIATLLIEPPVTKAVGVLASRRARVL